MTKYLGYKQLMFKFTPDQHKKLKVLAAQEAITMKDFVLKALDHYEKNVINK